MSERPSERGADRAVEAKNWRENQSLAKSQETQEDLRTKEAFSSVVAELRPAMQADVESMRKMVAELREREMSRLNFVSPENMLGQSTWVRGDGKTFSGERLETIESMLETMEMRLSGMTRMEGLIKSWATLEEMKKDPFVSRFLVSPEGQLMQGVLFSGKDSKTVEAEYYLAKARELRSGIIRGDELAQCWYEKLDGTPLEKVGQEERMSIGSRTLRKGREFANSMLGLDSLGMMVAWAGIGRLAGTLISNSERFRNAALATTTAVNESYAARAIPWVTFLRGKAGETVAMRVSKWTVNFLGEVGKGFAYTEAARALGGDDLAHAVSYPLMFIPGLRSEFEGSLKIALADKPENFRVFARWLVQKYKSPEKLEAAMATWLNEANARAKWNVGIDEARQILGSVRSGTAKLFERFKPEKTAAETTNRPTASTASVAEKAGTAITENHKPGPTARNAAESSEIQPGTSEIQEAMKTRVAEAIGNEESLQRLTELGLPKDYALALRELDIPDEQIIKMKGWNEKTIHRKEHIDQYLSEFNRLAEANRTPKMTEEEAHALFGYTTNLFYRQLNGKLWKDDGENLKITSMLRSALSKMPDAAPTQFRWDEKLLDNFLREHGLFDRFVRWEKIPNEEFDALVGETMILKWFTSTGNEATEPFWSKLDKTKYQITIRNSNARDITGLAFFPNFGHELKNWARTTQESLFQAGETIRIVSVRAARKADGTPVLKIVAERNGGELAK